VRGAAREGGPYRDRTVLREREGEVPSRHSPIVAGQLLTSWAVRDREWIGAIRTAGAQFSVIAKMDPAICKAIAGIVPAQVQ